MKKIPLFIFSLYGMLVFVAIMLILFPFILIISIIPKYGIHWSFHLVRLWSFCFSIFTFIHIKVENRKSFPNNKGHLYICNHTSFLDAIAIVQAVRGTIKPLGKVELLKFPILGWIIGRFAILVNRKDKESRKKSVQKLMESVNDGDSVFIFPEGTMNRTDQLLQRFFDGAFRISEETGIPIIPLVILNAGKLLPPGKFRLRPGKVRVVYGDPIDSSLSKEEMMRITRKWMLSYLEEH